MADLKIHCQTCGKKLEKVEKETSFDRATGDPVSTTFYICPEHNADPRHDSLELSAAERAVGKEKKLKEE